MLCPALLLAVLQATPVQTPDYMKDLPAPDSVLARIHGSDEWDTAARQDAVMNLLWEVVLTLSHGWHACLGRPACAPPLTPDERAHSGPYFDAAFKACVTMNRLRSHSCSPNPYAMNESFLSEALTLYLPPATREEYQNRRRQQTDEETRPQREAEAAARAFASVTTSTGSSHTCGLTPAGAAYCWGENGNGQLGIGSHDETTTPTAVAGGLKFVSLGVGDHHTCGATTTGTYCWGDVIPPPRFYCGNPMSGLPECPNANPVAVEGGLSFVSLSAGDEYTCGVTAAGAAYCWGNTQSLVEGQLGAGKLCEDNPARCVPLTPVPVAGGIKFASVSAGWRHACGLTTTGRAYCWGRNASGQLGVGSVATPCGLLSCSMTPVPVAAGTLRFASLSAGADHTCGITTAGAAYCWGSNDYGQLGARTTQGCGGTPCAKTPLAVTGALKFASVSATERRTCGITADGTVYCWGDVESLGAPATARCQNGTCAAAPVTVPVGGVKFASLTAAAEYFCGIGTTGATYCWGANHSGQLGDGTTDDKDRPTLISGLQPARQR